MSDTPGEVTAYNTSPEGQLLNASVNAIIDLALPDILGNVWLRAQATLKGINTLPAVVVSPFPSSHIQSEGTLTAPDVTFRQAVMIVFQGERIVSEYAPEQAYIQHQLILHFAKNADAISASLVDGCHLLWSGIDLGDPRVISLWKENLDASWIFLAHKVRYPSTA